MKTPKMILFDYGHTLAYEPKFDALRGEEALFAYVTKNPNGITPQQANAFAARIFGEAEEARKVGFEVAEHPMLRLKNEYLGLEYSVGLTQAETIFWEAASPGQSMPGVAEMLNFLHKKGIRTGVISNIGWSGKALTERLNRLLPENQFEFILASSEYGLRKPNPLLFLTALQKAGLPASEVWYCGDNPSVDVEGSAKAGLYPVWYENALECTYRDKKNESIPTCSFLHIHEWAELTERLEEEECPV